MKKLVFNLLLIQLLVFTSCISVNEKEATNCTENLFSYILKNKTSQFYDLYPESRNFECIYNFTDFSIKEIGTENGYVRVCLITEYQNESKEFIKKDVKLFLDEIPDSKDYIVVDSKGIACFNDTDFKYLMTKNTEIKSEDIQEMTDVEISDQIKELKVMKSVSAKILKAVKNKNWRKTKELYDTPDKFTFINNLKNYDIIEYKWVKENLAMANISAQFQTGYNKKEEGDIQLYFKVPNNNEPTLIDSEGLTSFKPKKEQNEYGEKIGAPVNDISKLTDMETVNLYLDIDKIKNHFFKQVQQEINDNLELERWTTVAYSGMSHYEHAKCTNNTPYTINVVKYHWSDYLDRGTTTLARDFKPEDSKTFQPSQFELTNGDNTSLRIIVDDSSIMDIVNDQLKYSGKEYSQFKEGKLK